MSERKGTRALELWCKRLVRDCPNVRIENMTTSWRNGLAFCALVHHFRPDLIDVSSLKPENIYENNQLAFSLAEKHLGIPALLDPEDMVANEVPDRLSVLTYLSQFYQRLGHTVNTKVNDNDSSQSGTSPNPMTSQPSALTKFGKAGLDKCAACDLPVYLAQRLIVSQKLYHRRCFRCSKCTGHLNPHSFKNFVGTEFVCDTCKTEKVMSMFLNNNDVQMGMLAFTDSLHEQDTDSQVIRPVADKQTSRPQSIIDKINMFEKNVAKDDISNKIDNITLKESDDMPPLKAPGSASTSQETKNDISPEYTQIVAQESMHKSTEIYTPKKTSENLYKSDLKKYAFLKTQLQGDTKTDTGTENDIENKENFESNEKDSIIDSYSPKIELKEECNVTDDTRLAKSVKPPSSDETSNDLKETEKEASISVPPRRKKRISPEKIDKLKDVTKINKIVKEYPDHLNPFSEDEEEDENPVFSKKESSNPFGSSDEEDDEVPPIARATTTSTHMNETPTRRLISANPFWSDDEEPSTDEDDRNDTSSSMYKSSVTTSTPNLCVSTPHRKKTRAPPPPPTIMVSALTTSMDDVASISSVSSYNSTVHSDQKCHDKLTPLTMRSKRPAPTPPDSISTLSEGSRDLQGGGGSTEKEGDSIESGGWRHTKRPAPGLPLPSRREVKLQMSPEELQVQLELLETQQLGLERQGVLIEQMIRDKCEGDEAIPVPQEEVEDLVIQLCELVNEKNDLFRKQTELMYIRRQQRLEQEQADIEHEIRVIQSRPAVNRIDADKAREEQLVSRLVEIVRLRDELVQSLDAERRRERQEDLAIAASIASRRAQRNSESNSSSLKSVEVVVPKKNKVKDKMKKQLKKAKHTFIHSKKKEGSEKKHDEKSPEKDTKSKAAAKDQ